MAQRIEDVCGIAEKMQGVHAPLAERVAAAKSRRNGVGGSGSGQGGGGDGGGGAGGSEGEGGVGDSGGGEGEGGEGDVYSSPVY